MLSKKMIVSSFTANTTIKVLCTKYMTLAIKEHYDIALSNPNVFSIIQCAKPLLVSRL